MGHYNGASFEEAYDNGASVNTLLELLDSTIVKISRKFFKKFDYAVGRDDIAQEVRIHIWELLDKTDYLTGKTGEEAYKYIVTAIRLWAIRSVSRLAAKSRKRKRTKQGAFATELILSIFNVEYLDNEAEIPCEVLVDRLKERCKDIENVDRVFAFLAPTEDLGRIEDKENWAGLPINAFYKVVNEIKERARDIGYE